MAVGESSTPTIDILSKVLVSVLGVSATLYAAGNVMCFSTGRRLCNNENILQKISGRDCIVGVYLSYRSLMYTAHKARSLNAVDGSKSSDSCISRAIVLARIAQRSATLTVLAFRQPV